MTFAPPSTSTHRRIGLIGFGAIGQTFVRGWREQPVPGHTLAAVLARPHQLAAARESMGAEVRVTDSLDAFLDAGLDLAVEAAGQGAVVQLGAQILRAGVDFMTLSVGSLADERVATDLREAAAAGGARVLVPVGAIAGLDGLQALRRAGLDEVLYTSTKPPTAWQGTPAQQAVDLDALTRPAVVFEGSAREAALRFPKNANLAAAVALAGLGLDATRVRLVADPAATGNTGRIDAKGAGSQLTVTVAGSSEPGNPKSSAIVGLSVLAALDNAARRIAFV